MKKFKPKTVEYDYIGFFLHNLVQLSCKLFRNLILKSIKANTYIKLSPINAVRSILSKNIGSQQLTFNGKVLFFVFFYFTFVCN